MIKKLLRFIAIGVVTLIVIGVIAFLFIDKPVPNGTQGADAEDLASEMLTALNKSAYDTLKTISFNYADRHSYVWNKAEKTVVVSWENNEVSLNLNIGPDTYTTLQYEAYEYFINDSFWLVAPFKVRDSGVIRSAVQTETGRGLLVSYTSGGVTPGDSYLWILDENGFPSSWRLWTSNVPIGGLEITWGGWRELQGVWFSTFHTSKLLDFEIKDLQVN